MELLSTMFAPPRRPRAMFAHDHPADNPPALADLAAQLASYVRDAAAAGTPVHQAERALWQRLLALGRAALTHFFALQGTGDVGPTVTLADGHTFARLPEQQ